MEAQGGEASMRPTLSRRRGLHEADPSKEDRLPCRGVNRPGKVGLSRKNEPTRLVRVEKILSRDTLLNLQTRDVSGDLG